MSCLFIDSSERGTMRLALLPVKGRIRARRISVLPGSAVAALAAFFSRSEMARGSGVCVVAGPGSFSAVRGGVIAANLLARLLDVPLYGLSHEEARDLTRVRERLVAGRLAAQPYVAPVYDAEPNITC